MWNLKKIEEYIQNGIEENTHLDYKSADSLGKSYGKKSEISKDVSAFTNSDGGIIIYGVSEYNEPEKKHLPEKVNPINRIDFSKEWLEQIINSNISPRIKDIKIKPIQVGVKSNNQVIYVVEIPKSNTAHQAKDKRYYKRYNFESIPMEDYEIKDIINRSNKTDIEIRLKLRDTNKDDLIKTLDGPNQIIIKTDVLAKNNGNIIAHYVDIYVKCDKIISNLIYYPEIPADEEVHLYYSNLSKMQLPNGTWIDTKDREPILPKAVLKIGYFSFHSAFFNDNRELFFSIATEDDSKKIRLEGKKLLDIIE